MPQHTASAPTPRRASPPPSSAPRVGGHRGQHRRRARDGRCWEIGRKTRGDRDVTRPVRGRTAATKCDRVLTTRLGPEASRPSDSCPDAAPWPRYVLNRGDRSLGARVPSRLSGVLGDLGRNRCPGPARPAPRSASRHRPCVLGPWPGSSCPCAAPGREGRAPVCGPCCDLRGQNSHR